MIKKQLIRIIELIAANNSLCDQDYELLRQDLLDTQECLQIIDLGCLRGLDRVTIDAIIYQRSQLLKSTYSEILQILDSQKISLDLSSKVFMLWYYWIPLAQNLANQQQKLGRTFIQGLLGGQGTGKTTLGLVLNVLLKNLGKTFLSISLDDIYKTYLERQKIRDRRPALIWRGPPSTHDIDLGIEVLQKLRDRDPNHPQAITIPRFDKSLYGGAGDRLEPEISYGADIVLFEGWFVGLRPLPISAFRNFVPPILTESDRDFALECNANLYNYLPLWDCLDSLIVLVPKDYNYSIQWRLEAEHKLINSGKTGMDDEEIIRFVEYFWKALHPELFMPHLIGEKSSDRLLGAPIAIHGDRPNSQHTPINLVIEISRSHLPTSIQTQR